MCQLNVSHCNNVPALDGAIIDEHCRTGPAGFIFTWYVPGASMSHESVLGGWDKEKAWHFNGLFAQFQSFVHLSVCNRGILQ